MNVLFITATRVGDAVLSTGILNRLIADHPQARVTVACGPVAAPLFAPMPNLERVIVLDKKPYSMHWLSLWAACVGRAWDIIVDLRRAPVAWGLFARRRFHARRDRQPIHRVVKMGALLGLADAPPAPGLWTSESDDRVAASVLPDGAPVLALGPTANWRAKTWRAEHFQELTRRLTGPDGPLPEGRVAVFGHGDERPQVAQLIDSVPMDRRVDLVGRVTLPELFACLKRCALYVGNDSGLMHMAAAAGIPTLGLFGPSREDLYAPWGPHCAVARTEKGFDTIFPVGFDHRTSDTLMDGLSVDRVEAAAVELWRRMRETPA